MSSKEDMNVAVTEKTHTGSIEGNTFTPDLESILDWIEWCIEVTRGMGKPTFHERLSSGRSTDQHGKLW